VAGIDVSFGDPICPPPTEIVVPRLVNLGQQPVRLLGYPLSMVVAEKTVTAIERGEANTRWRGFADLVTISRSQTLSAAELRRALETVAEFRQVKLLPLREALPALPDLAQSKWAAWRRQRERADQLPEKFADLLEEISDFIDPQLGVDPITTTTWDPDHRGWS
jgi:hypothetical protein